MSNNIKEFLQKLTGPGITNLERAIGVIWWQSRSDTTQSMDVSSIARILHHEAGYAEQNKTRLKNGLTKDKRTAKANGGEFRIRVGARDELDKQFGSIAQIKIAKVTNSVIPVELFQCTRGYIEKVVHQLNASYDCGLFDCTAVMCRRLLSSPRI